MFALLVFLANMSFGQTCSQDLTRILSSDPIPEAAAQAVKQAETAIGKSLTKEQSLALEDVLRKMPGDNYLASDISSQDKVLKKAGFFPEDIQLLRKRNILGNTFIKLSASSPTGVQIERLAFKELDASILKDLKAGKNFNYLVGENGEIHLTSETLKFPKDKMILAYDKNKTETAVPLLLRESGSLTFDTKKKTLVFKPTHGFENNEFASKALIQKVEALSPEIKATVTNPANTPASRVLKCLDIVSAQGKSKNFVLDRVIADNLVAVSAIATSEAYSELWKGKPGLLGTPEGRSLIVGDLIGGNANAVLGSVVSLGITKKELTWVQSFGIRAGMGISGAQVQKLMHEQTSDGENQEQVDEIAKFNTVHAMLRIPISHHFDKFATNTLPDLIFNACQKNPATSVLISPVAVRMYERYASSVLYYGVRQSVLGQ
jgi:hypothetical protein